MIQPANKSDRLFAGSSNNRSNQGNNPEQKKANYWLNVGYTVNYNLVDETTGEKTPATKFVNLAYGIPLDTMEDLKTDTNNPDWNNFQAARNGLRDKLIAAASKLEPGESKRIALDPETNLEIEIRRVGEPPALVADNENPYGADFNF